MTKEQFEKLTQLDLEYSKVWALMQSLLEVWLKTWDEKINEQLKELCNQSKAISTEKEKLLQEIMSK